MRTRHQPTRMCLGCKERIWQEELVRLQMTREGVGIVERQQDLGDGRSVYFCPKPGCFDKVLKKGFIVFKRSKYDKIGVCLEPRQVERLRYAFSFAARRLRGEIGVGPRDS